jgi:hypothetical protein
MNSYQLKQTARSRRNNAQKVQRPLLNFKASKDKAKDRRKSSSNDQNQEDIYRGNDAGDNEVISDHASGDDKMTWMILLVICKGQTDHPSITEVMRVTMNIVPLNLS